MNAAANWRIDSTMILSMPEIQQVLTDLKRRTKRSIGSRQNRVIFRLASCCGLRASEIVGLNLADVHVGIGRSYLSLPKRITKSRKARRIPLWWDAGTLADIESWKKERQQQAATGKDPFVCAQSADAFGHRLDRFAVRRKFKVACRCLGPERLQTLTIHHGRHSFISHALAGGKSLAQVRDCAGHSNVAITSIYVNVATDDDGEVGNLFDAA